MAKNDDMVKVTGAKELRREIRKMQDSGIKKELREAYKKSAEVVVGEAKGIVPKRSGALASSIRALGSQNAARVAAGSGKTSKYAGIIHFGNPHRGIRPRPFLYEARERRTAEVYKAFEEAMNEVAKSISSKNK